MEDEFGSAYARMLATDLVLAALDGRSATQALDEGYPPKAVWHAVCDQQEVPEHRRLGRDIKPKS